MSRNIDRDIREAEQRKERLLDAGFRLFTEKGIENVSLQAVAEAADVGVATLYKYYQTKTNLVVAISARIWSQVWEEYSSRFDKEELTSKNAYENIEVYIDAIIRIFEQKPDILKFSANYKTFINREGIQQEQLLPHLNILNPVGELFKYSYEKAKTDGSIRTDVSMQEMFTTISLTVLGMAERFVQGIVWTDYTGSSRLNELKHVKEMVLGWCRAGNAKRLMWDTCSEIGNCQIDNLTGLKMRNAGEAGIRECMLEGKGALILIDVDNLKKLNDIFGHQSGDLLLKELGNILKNLPDIAGACRIGGDEFLVFSHRSTEKDIRSVLTVLYEEFNKVKNSNEYFRYNSLSCGIVLTEPTAILEDAYSDADKALYFTKRNGKDGFHFFEKDFSGVTLVQSIDLSTVMDSFSVAGHYNGALEVDYREFVHMFEYVKHMQKRFRYEVHMLVFNLEVDSDAKLSGERISEAVMAMENAIRNTIRSVDISTLYSSTQFLVILSGAKSKEVDGVAKRILDAYHGSFDEKGISVSYKSKKIEE